MIQREHQSFGGRGCGQGRADDEAEIARAVRHGRRRGADFIEQAKAVERWLALIGQGLRVALRDYIRQWSQQTGMACEFQASCLPADSEAPVLRPEIEEALFRVAQEALANIARHSQAGQAQVRLEQGIDQVCLHVFDNGKGFIVEQVTDGGHGLANMRARVEAYGGTFHIRSGPGETVVTGCVPLARPVYGLKEKRKREQV